MSIYFTAPVFVINDVYHGKHMQFMNKMQTEKGPFLVFQITLCYINNGNSAGAV